MPLIDEIHIQLSNDSDVMQSCWKQISIISIRLTDSCARDLLTYLLTYRE